MNILLWVLQIVAAFLYAASGVMKVFMFDKISGDVPSFGALPRQVWMALGILETRLHGRPDRPRRLALASDTHGGGRRGPGDREPCVRWSPRQVPRGRVHRHGLRTRPAHGVHCLRPVCLEADSLTGRTNKGLDTASLFQGRAWAGLG